MKKIFLIACLIATIVLFSGCPQPPSESEMLACSNDTDCVIVEGSCCTCSMGGSQKAINKNYKDVWNSSLAQSCVGTGLCPALYNCNPNAHAICENKICQIQTCKGEGETIPVIANPPECCEGLILIPPKTENIVGIGGICTAKCGNGTCDTGTESNYNCPEDCSGGEGLLSIAPIDLTGVSAEFAGNYKLEGMEIPLQTLEYALPLETSAISNFADFSEKVELENSALQLLQKNGFVVTDYPFYEKQEYITTPYESLKDREIPIFITSDSLLHLYHIQFDETLRIIEEKEFYDAIWRISEKLVEQNQQKYVSSEDELKEAYKKNVAFFSVGMELLKPEQEQLCPADEDCFDPGIAAAYFTEEDLQNYTFEIPALVKEDVDAELALIEEHSGFGESPVFIYREDYSQYVPRGHYTRSEKLKNYFKAMMWYGRISFILKGCDAGCLVSEEEARLQTMAASITASEVNTDPAVKNDWDRIYSVTAFYVGLSDDLGPYEYIEALNYVFGSDFEPSQLNVDTVKELKAKLAEYHSPKIYGGTGACLIDPPFNPEQADECLESTKGFRLMGQRFIPDSYMFSNLVFPYASSYLGSGYAFTTVSSAAGSVRGFPRGLDAMALLGSQRAKELLTELGDDNYEGYGEAYAELEEEFNSFDNAEWNKNLYWAWLFALKPLLKEYDSGYPTFMQTTAWENKQLTTALASWAELRHDTILYAKQSYTPEGLGPGPQEPPVVGYIEPVPEFYNRLLALTSMTNAGLGEMDVLDDASKNRLESLAVILERLRDLSQKELENKELEQADYEFIKNFGDHLNGVIMDVPDKSKKTTIVADVHTDGNSKNVLEEGVGYVKLIAVAYKVPDGRVLIGAGPVMSYYEFKQPMSDRLTDEKWREILDSDEKPSEPEWAGEFYS